MRFETSTALPLRFVRTSVPNRRTHGVSLENDSGGKHDWSPRRAEVALHAGGVAICRLIGFARDITRRADAAGKTQEGVSWLLVSLLMGVVVLGVSLPL